MENRKNYVDYMKMFAIFFVVWGHSALTAPELKQLIYAVHMPLFFFVYGITYRLESHEQKGFLTMRFVVDKVKRLLFPYLVWSIAWLIVCGNFEFSDFAGMLYGSQMTLKNIGTVTSLWFLPCMFLVELLFELCAEMIHNLKHKNIVLLITVVGIIIVVELLPRIESGYPWSINVSLMALIFVICGFLMKSFVANIMEQKPIKDIAVLCLSGVAFLATCWINIKFLETTHNVDMASANYGVVALFIADALEGIMALCIVAKYFDKLFRGNFIGRWLLFVGQNTMCIFLLHKPILQLVCEFIQIDSAILRQLVSVALSVLVLIFCAIIAFLVRKFIPEIVGEKRLKSHDLRKY